MRRYFARRVRRARRPQAWTAVTLALIALISFFALPVASTDASPLVLRGATVHPVSEPSIDSGVVVIEGDRIVAVGPAGTGAEAIAAGARVVDVSGRHVWPGLIDAFGYHGLTEIGSVRGTVDYDESGSMNPAVRAEIAVNASSTHFPATRTNGVLLGLVAPSGGLVPGRVAAIALDGWTSEEMVRAAPVGLLIEWPAMGPPTKEGERPPAEKEIARLDTMIEEARAYARARDAGDVDSPPDVGWEALVDVVRGDVPVWIRAETIGQMRAALDWTAERRLELVLVSGSSARGGDAARCADELAARGVPVVCHSTRLPLRAHEPYDAPFTEAAVLHAAGVQVAFGTWTSSSARRLPQEAARASAFGLPPSAALASVTLEAARILGVDDRYGSLEPGKSATLLVTDRDVLDIRMNVERAWLDGRELDLDDPQKKLRRHWASRPAPTER